MASSIDPNVPQRYKNVKHSKYKEHAYILREQVRKVMQNDLRMKAVWNQKNIPVALRRDGKGEQVS
ncbi:MAG: hypothetical protein ACKVKF_06665 [Rhodobacterales bacterium]